MMASNDEVNLDDMSDEELKQLEAELEAESQGQIESFGVASAPGTPDKDTTLKFFREIKDGKESTKVANFNSADMLQARGFLKVASVCDVVKLDKVAAHLRTQVEDISATSMGFKGFFAQLLVTQIKKEQKIKPQAEFKKGLFGYKKSEGVQ